MLASYTLSPASDKILLTESQVELEIPNFSYSPKLPAQEIHEPQGESMRIQYQTNPILRLSRYT